MKRYSFVLLLALFALLGGGCLNFDPKPQVDRTQFYRLPDPVPEAMLGNAGEFSLHRVTLPDYLATDAFWIEKAPMRFEERPFERWVEPLEAAVKRILISISAPRKEGRPLLVVNILAFHPELYTGQVLLRACVQMEGAANQMFEVRVPINRVEDPSAWVSSMAAAVNVLAQDLTKGVWVSEAYNE